VRKVREETRRELKAGHGAVGWSACEVAGQPAGFKDDVIAEGFRSRISTRRQPPRAFPAPPAYGMAPTDP